MVTKYQVHITRHAYYQMKEIRRYIAEDLSSPEAAKNLLLKMREDIAKLQTMPKKHSLVDEEPWRSKGIRRLIVKNFIVYYWTDEENKRVNITAVVYGKREQLKQLSLMKKD